MNNNLDIIANLTAVEAISVSYGKYSYVAIEADGTRHQLASKAAKRENVFFYSFGNINGNNHTTGALNGHCTYGQKPNAGYYRNTFIRGIKVTFVDVTPTVEESDEEKPSTLKELLDAGDVISVRTMFVHLTLQRTGDEYVMAGSSTGTHRISAHNGSDDRIYAHWDGYQKNAFAAAAK